MFPNELTWKQRGAIDYLIGTPLSESPAPDLFEREQWEQGYHEAFERCQAGRMLAQAEIQKRVLAELQTRN